MKGREEERVRERERERRYLFLEGSNEREEKRGEDNQKRREEK